MAKLIKGVNDLATVHPELVEEWDYEKNGFGPDEIADKSSLNAWWECSEGHSFQTRVYNRTRSKSKCPYCVGKLPIKGKTDLATIYPKVAEEWDYEKNYPLRPEYVTAHSSKKVWWICEEGHGYLANISSRTEGCGCPYCAGKLPIKGKTDLATLYPEVVEEWDYDSNNFRPDEVTAHSGKKAVWICKKEKHRYVAPICKRSNGHGCPYCAGKLPIKGKTDLATVHPEFIEEWDYKTNGVTPYEVSYASNKKFAWVCKKEKHRYEATVNNRHSGKGCPYCAGNRPIPGKTDFATVYPELLDEWDYANNEISPDKVTASSGKKINWICKKERHPYSATIANRVRGKGCPYCAGNRPIPGKTDLETCFAEVCLNWDYEKNKKGPDEYSYASNKKVYWKCHKCGYKYRRSICVEVCSSGCIKCKKK